MGTLQWARAHGCDGYYRTCERAARGGHLEFFIGLGRTVPSGVEKTIEEAALDGTSGGDSVGER